MKIIFAIKRLENMAGGAERVILQVIDGLRRDYGHDITLITFDRKDACSFYPLPNGLHWIKMGIGDSAQRAGVGETIKRIFALRRVIKTINPDCIIPFQHSMFVPVAFATTGFRQPMIASEHIVPDHYRKRPLEYFLLLLSSSRYKKITVLSDKIIAMYPKFLRSRMVAVPNPLVTFTRETEALPTGRKLLLSVGRLDPQKDQKTLISAFSFIAEKVADWDLEIVGDGVLRDSLKKQISDLGMDNRIYLSGATPNIIEKYRKASAFVLASLYESFGLATAEAMSGGLPVIGFADCPGTNELIQHNINGLLVSVPQGGMREECLSQGLLKLMTDSELQLRLGQQGQLDMKGFSSEAVIEKWNQLITSL